MPPSIDCDIHSACRHPLVRDLAWLTLAPDLVALAWPGRPSRRALGLDDDAALRAFLATLEADPAGLETRIGPSLQGRMGHYHERLWQFLLDAAPGTRLLAHNLPVIRERRTLGELDIVYREAADPAPIHLEVAIKFYLGLPEGPGDDDAPSRWIGPGGVDSLAAKCAHLARHQLPLTNLPDARAALATRLGAPVDAALRQRLAMPGVLFYPRHHSLPPPRGATAAHRRGEWLYWGDWPALRDDLAAETRGAWLHKPHWLALPRPEQLAPLWALEQRLQAHFAANGAPIQLALRAPTGNPAPAWQRVFVVGNDWPRQIPLPPSGS